MKLQRNNFILKSLIYRIFATVFTVAISFILTGDFNIALTIGGLELFSKIFIYYIYDIIWDKITNRSGKNI